MLAKLISALKKGERVVRIGYGDRLLAVTNQRVLILDRKGKNDSIQFKEIEEIEDSAGEMGGKGTLVVFTSEPQGQSVSGIQPDVRAQELAELIEKGMKRGNLNNVRSGPKRVTDRTRKRRLSDAIQQLAEAGYRVEHEAEFSAVLDKGGFRVHHGGHLLGTVLTGGYWGVVWGAQALRGKERRVRLTVDQWGQLVADDRRIRAPTRSSARKTVR